MKLNIDFLFGLLTYVRVSSLSLDRSNEDFANRIQDFYKKNNIPDPFEVLNAMERKGASVRNGREGLFSLIGFQCRNHVGVSAREFDEIRSAIFTFSEILGRGPRLSDGEKISARIKLSNCEEILNKAIGEKKSSLANAVDHLGSSDYLDLFSFREIVGPNWP